MDGTGSAHERPLGRPRLRWEDYTKINVGEIGLEGMDRIHVVQDSDQWHGVVYTAVNYKRRGVS
jgi:hypothetical protein